MILFAFLAVQIGVAGSTSVAYPRLPREVVSASIYEWSDTLTPVLIASTGIDTQDAVVLTGRPGRRVVVAFVRRDGAHMLDGPFVWPDRNAEHGLDDRWRRSVILSDPPGAQVNSAPAWLSAAEDVTWPQFRRAVDGRWEGWGIPLAESGVVVHAEAGKIWWSTVQHSSVSAWRNSAWGRLIIAVNRDGRAPAQLRLEPQRAVPPPAYRMKGIRLETAAVPSVITVPLSPGSTWIAGSDPPEQSWLKASAADASPMFVPLADLATGATTAPERIEIDPARPLDGTVVAGTVPASRATVTLFRLIDPPSHPEDRHKPRRVFAAETTTNDDGSFTFDTLGTGDYEVLAWHPQFGHASVLLQPAQHVVTVRLEQPGIARGRVLFGGKPAAGADVYSVPDADAFSNAEDPADAKGGDARTDAAGRFVVTLAPIGGGELRIGGGTYPTRRVALPSSPLPLVDLGDIELGAPLVVRVVLDQDPGCSLLATGPVGRLGLQVITGERTGPGIFRVTIAEEGQWEFGLECGGTIEALTPALVSIEQSLNGKEVRLSVVR